MQCTCLVLNHTLQLIASVTLDNDRLQLTLGDDKLEWALVNDMLDQ